jgi:hypothetical protein
LGLKRVEVREERRRLHNKKLYAQYSTPNNIRVIKTRRLLRAEHVASMGDRRVGERILVGKPEARKPLERPRRRRKDNIKMDILEVVCGGMEWIVVALDRDRW